MYAKLSCYSAAFHTLPRSTSLVVITITLVFSCHTIHQKSASVEGRQPCVAMQVLVSIPRSSSLQKFKYDGNNAVFVCGWAGPALISNALNYTNCIFCYIKIVLAISFVCSVWHPAPTHTVDGLHHLFKMHICPFCQFCGSSVVTALYLSPVK